PRGLAQTLNCVGSVLYKRKENAAALDYYRKARATQQGAGDREGEALTLFNMALAERDSGNLAEARSYVEQSLVISEELRAQVANQNFRASYFASVHQRYELRIDILMRLYHQHPSNDLLAAAIESSEQSHARNLFEILGEHGVDDERASDPALTKAKLRLLSSIQAAEELRVRLLGAGRKEQAAEVAKKLESLNADYEAIEEKLSLAGLADASLKKQAPLSLKQLQQETLDSRTVLFEYALGDDRSYLWAITDTGIKGYELPPRALIETLARRVRQLLSDPDSTPEKDRLFWSEAAKLSSMVLGPARSQLADKRIVVVADGGLQYIPFSVLPDPNPPARPPVDPAVPMVIQHEVVDLPSAGILAEIRRVLANRKPAPLLIAVLADPIFDRDDSRLAARGDDKGKEAGDLIARLRGALASGGETSAAQNLPALPGTEDEARAVMELVPDPNQRLIALGLAA
ncbi:MAG: tetratricopeptide repeat protein, partial [Blastocatellia bacterium]